MPNAVEKATMSFHTHLKGIRVLDLTSNVAGPYATMILADYGAAVTRVEPVGGDPARQMTPIMDGVSVPFQALNRGKTAVELNLKSTQGADKLEDMISRADILVQSMRPGALARLGFSYERTQEINPEIIYCSISGYGQEPIAESQGGYDPLIQAYSGMMSMTGEEGGSPVRTGASVIDMTTGMWTAMGILLALSHRKPGEPGPHIQVSLLDTAMSLMTHQVASTLVTDQEIVPLGTASPLMAPYQALETSTAPIMVAAPNDSLFNRLCQRLGRTDLATDGRFATNAQRVRNREELISALSEVTRTASADHWLSVLHQAGIPATAINTLREAARAPLVRDREVITQDSRTIPAVRLPLRFNGVPFPVAADPAPIQKP